VELLVDCGRTTGMGVVELADRLPALVAAFLKLERLVERWRPRAALLVDAPDFNMRLGARLRARGVSVLGYIAPQLWAWRGGRVATLGRAFDRLACVLPFEEPLLRRAGVDASFVGHPACEGERPTRREARLALGIGPDAPCLALLPGSRPAELHRLLSLMLAASRRLRSRKRGLSVLLARASTVHIAAPLPRWCRVVEQRRGASAGRWALAAADAAMVASGTATLEAMMADTPQVAVYRLSPLSYVVARALVRSRFFALPNILLQRQAVPQLFQRALSVDALSRWGELLLEDRALCQGQIDAAAELRSKLGGAGASSGVAQMLCEMLA
jgi:lipid-A-disaccharide synthase